MNVEKVIKSSQEQAVASWINYLNQIRIDRLLEALTTQDNNLATAMDTIESAFATIKDEIVDRNRGGDKGMHGFIAEIAETGIGNARQHIIGHGSVYEWVNDNGPVDLQRGAEAIQQKFVNSGGHLSLKAVAEHLRHYPDFLENGGKYQIPKDHYDKIMKYLAMPADVANKLPTSDGEFNLHQWKEVHEFFESGSVDVNKLEPSILEYREVQKGTIDNTFDSEKKHLQDIDQKQRDTAYQNSKPSFGEGAKATAMGAAAEGGMAFIMAVAKKRKSGKKLKDFTESDWTEIVGETGQGTAKGGIRGASIYLLTNFTATPAAAASALTTASFGVAEQAHLYRDGAIDELEFIENAEMLCLDATVSAVSSFAGQIIIPIPILGAVLGNVVGTLIYQIGKDTLSAKENELINSYLAELTRIDSKLSAEYSQFIDRLNKCYAEYIEILTAAFDPDFERALEGSVVLAKRMGVPDEEVLDTYDKIYSYFTD